MDQQTLHVVVTIANATFTTFRIAAHVPQLLAVVRDTSGARAISVGSWVMFAIANLSNAVYALVIADDWLMFGINLLSTASCAAIGGSPSASSAASRAWRRRVRPAMPIAPTDMTPS